MKYNCLYCNSLMNYYNATMPFFQCNSCKIDIEIFNDGCRLVKHNCNASLDIYNIDNLVPQVKNKHIAVITIEKNCIETLVEVPFHNCLQKLKLYRVFQ